MGQLEEGLTRLSAAFTEAERALAALFAPERFAAAQQAGARDALRARCGDALREAAQALREAMDEAEAALNPQPQTQTQTKEPA